LIELQAFIAGVAITSLVFYIYDYIAGYVEYARFKKWLVSIDVDVHSIDEASFDSYFALWELSKLPGVEISGLTGKDDDDGISEKD
jgi:hypothetical protein